MQNQFDQWYNNLHSRTGLAAAEAAAHGSSYSQQLAHYGDTNSSISSDFTNGNSRYSYDSTADAKDAGAGAYNGSSSSSGIGAYNRSGAESKGSGAVRRGSGSSQSTIVDSYSYGTAAASASVSSAAAVPSSMRGPDRKGIDDGDVNEDIMAFYQAKEELMKFKASSGAR